MKNILMITPLYPIPSKENQITYVCQYFSNEWIKMGYNVLVIHLQPVHNWLWHLAVKTVRKNRSATSYAKKLKKTEHYHMDYVNVYRVPVYQTSPRIDFTYKTLTSFANTVKSITDSEGFVPDIIVGHCMAPHIIPAVNELYHAKTVMVAHGPGNDYKQKYSNWEQIVDSYDAWGFRAEPIRKNFEINVKKVKHEFICYSGIPSDYIAQENKHDFTQPLRRFIFVGSMIQRKHPLELIDALNIEYPSHNYELTYVGKGELLEELKSKVEREGLGRNVHILGAIPRDRIKDYYDTADCMMMISYGEAYGLVYLEAMARGCITIASKDEGVDGVIIDGLNGFLCKAGNVKELASIISRINMLSSAERKSISEKALETVKNLTDYKAAKLYVEELEKIMAI